jgi:hypothetical protein
MIDYLKNSDLILKINLNPYNWTLIPQYHRGVTVYDENDFQVRFLFLTIKLTLDDGSW